MCVFLYVFHTVFVCLGEREESVCVSDTMWVGG